MKTCNIFLTIGIPEHRNAMYQRALFLSKEFDLHIYTFKGRDVAPRLRERATIHLCPLDYSFLKRLKIYGHLIETLLFTLWIAANFMSKENFFVYTFHMNGFSAAGLLKLIKGKSMIWVTDMQHTPYYYYDDSRRSEMPFLKKVVYGPIGLLYLVLGKLFLPRADTVVAMSFEYGEGFARIMAEDFKVKKERLLPAPNGVDLANLERIAAGGRRSSIRIPDTKTKLLYAGNVRIERIGLLNDFLMKYRENCPDTSLIICGEMPADTLGVFENIRDENLVHCGFIPHDELLMLYKEVDLVLALIDGFMRDHNYSHPGKVYEAMAAGKVVAVNRLESVSRLVKDGYNGLIVDVDDLEKECGRIQEIISDPGERRRIEENAVKSVEFLDWKNIHPKWFARIRELVTK